MSKKSKIILFPILCLAVLGVLFIGTKFVYRNDIQCVILKNFGLYCPGCGITRSLICLFHFNFIKSFLYYPTLYFVFFFILYRYICLVLSYIKRKEVFSGRIYAVLVIAIPASVIIHWILINFV